MYSFRSGRNERVGDSMYVSVCIQYMYTYLFVISRILELRLLLCLHFGGELFMFPFAYKQTAFNSRQFAILCFCPFWFHHFTLHSNTHTLRLTWANKWMCMNNVGVEWKYNTFSKQIFKCGVHTYFLKFQQTQKWIWKEREREKKE